MQICLLGSHRHRARLINCARLPRDRGESAERGRGQTDCRSERFVPHQQHDHPHHYHHHQLLQLESQFAVWHHRHQCRHRHWIAASVAKLIK